MSVESMVTPQDANVAWPAAGDARSEGDDHIRGVKVMLKKLVYEQVGTIAAAGAASINTASSIGAFVSGYDYILTGEGIYGSTNSILRCQVTNSAAADTGNNYGYSINQASGVSVTHVTAVSQASIPLTGSASIGDASSEAARISLTILNPMGTANPRQMEFSVGMINNGGAGLSCMRGDGIYASATAADGLVIYPSSGTFTGTFNLYRCFRPA